MPKYKGTFNWQGEIHMLYRVSNKPNMAMFHMIAALAKKLGINRHKVHMYFSQDKNNYIIEEVKE